MRTYLIICFLGMYALISSCNEQSVSTETSNTTPPTVTETKTEAPPAAPADTPKALHKEVMHIHDVAMAKMEDIYQLKKQIKGVLKNAQKTENPEQIKDAIKERLDELDVADEAMMDWMRKYRQPKDKTDEEAMAYLQSEKVKIEEVSKVMNEAIGKAEKFLEGVK